MEYENRRENYALNQRQKHVLEIYRTRHKENRHKMEAIPVCVIPGELRGDKDN